MEELLAEFRGNTGNVSGATLVTMRRRPWETRFERVDETPTAMLVPYCRNSSLKERISKACPWPSFTCVPPADGF